MELIWGGAEWNFHLVSPISFAISCCFQHSFIPKCNMCCVLVLFNTTTSSKRNKTSNLPSSPRSPLEIFEDFTGSFQMLQWFPRGFLHRIPFPLDKISCGCTSTFHP
jgi:hypothetical protein